MQNQRIDADQVERCSITATPTLPLSAMSSTITNALLTAVEAGQRVGLQCSTMHVELCFLKASEAMVERLLQLMIRSKCHSLRVIGSGWFPKHLLHMMSSQASELQHVKELQLDSMPGDGRARQLLAATLGSLPQLQSLSLPGSWSRECELIEELHMLTGLQALHASRVELYLGLCAVLARSLVRVPMLRELQLGSLSSDCPTQELAGSISHHGSA